MPAYISHSSTQSLWRSTRARDYVRRPRIAGSRPRTSPIRIARSSRKEYCRRRRSAHFQGPSTSLWRKTPPGSMASKFAITSGCARFPSARSSRSSRRSGFPRRSSPICRWPQSYPCRGLPRMHEKSRGALSEPERAFVPARPPLTSLGLLAQYLSKSAGARGACRARKTLS